jgi:hypothetical protein
MMRQFTSKKATRQSVPLLFGITGPSGSGKTYSALRLSRGIQRVVGGSIHVIDTEHNRSLHYADDFDFTHVPFDPPFSPLDYLAAIEHCVSEGARTIVVDSTSHEHEGPGGVLEWHDKEAHRLAEKYKSSVDAQNFPAWTAPKAARTRMIQRILQLGCNAIFCFRAKEKMRPPNRKKGERDMVELGWMPIGATELVYEFVANALLDAGCKGVPTWLPARPGEIRITKLPRQFESILNPNGQPAQLSEDLGELMAKWAAGTDPFAEAMQAIRSASNQEQLASCAERLKTVKAAKSVTPQQYRQLTDAWKAQQAGIEAADNDAAAGAQTDEHPDSDNDGR